MDAQRFDPTKKVGLSPLLIPQAPEVGLSFGDQVVSPNPEMGANDEERQYTFLQVPPPTPSAVRRQKSYDAQRFGHSKQKSAVASAIASPAALFPASGATGFVAEEATLLDSVAFKLPSPPAEDEYYSTDSDPSHSTYETSSGSEVGTPNDDHVDRRIIRPQRSGLGLRKSFSNLKKARSCANLPKLPCTATFGVPTPVSSNDSLPSTTGSVDMPPPSRLSSRRPSMATLSSPAALNEVTDTLRKLASRLNLRDTERNFNEAVDYYERTWARAESGDGAIEVCVEHTKETFTDRPQSRSGQMTRPDGIGLYARPRSRKNTMPVTERPHQEVPL
ncbi:hypothetical protein LXA43DRAFT_645265 [Ganoderma leucocontextum]|nr:hypothetical protein LXA43DRAFT_645265 [Ganoderma leucocontextum]